MSDEKKTFKFLVNRRSVTNEEMRPSRVVVTCICHEVSDAEGKPLKMTLEMGSGSLSEKFFVGNTVEMVML